MPQHETTKSQSVLLNSSTKNRNMLQCPSCQKHVTTIARSCYICGYNINPLYANGVSGQVQSFIQTTQSLEIDNSVNVGRNKELQDLFYCLDKFLKTKNALQVSITGDAGIGKTTLVNDFVQNLGSYNDPEMVILRGRCLHYGNIMPYEVFKILIKNYFNIKDTTNAKTYQKQFMLMFHNIYSHYNQKKPIRHRISKRKQKQYAQLISYFLDINFEMNQLFLKKKFSEKDLQNMAFEAFKSFFHVLSYCCPVIVIIDDIQWIDNSSMKLIQYLMKECQSMPIMFIFMTRLEKIEIPENMPTEQHCIVKIQPLNRQESGELVRHILTQSHNIPEELDQLIWDNSGGNPYYIEEITKLMIDLNVLVKDAADDQWIVNWTNFVLFHMPPSLTDLIQVRIDALEPDLKSILQKAAIFGYKFWKSGLEKITHLDRIKNIELQKALLDLEDHKLVVFCSETSDGEKEYRFANILIQETIYKNIPLDVRKKYHHLASIWIRQKYANSLMKPLNLMAYHNEQSGSVSDAFKLYLQIAEDAKKKYSNNEATIYFRKALKIYEIEELRNQKSENKWTKSVREKHLINILENLAELNYLIGQYQNAEMWFQKCLLILRTDYICDGNFCEINGRINRKLALVFKRKGEYQNAIRKCFEGLNYVRANNCINEKVKLESQLGSLYYNIGKFDLGTKLFKKIEKELQNIEHDKTSAEINNSIGLAYFKEGNYSQAKHHFQQALSLMKSLQDIHGLADVCNNLGIIALEQDKYEQAEVYFKQSRKSYQAFSNIIGTAGSLNNLGIVFFKKGIYYKALNWYKKSKKLYEAVGHPLGLANYWINSAEIFIAQGQIKKTENALKHSLLIVNKVGNQYYFGEIYRLLAEVELQKNNYIEAKKWINKSKGIAKKTGNLLEYAKCLKLSGDIAFKTNKLNDTYKYYLECMKSLKSNGHYIEFSKMYNEFKNIFGSKSDYQHQHLDDIFDISNIEHTVTLKNSLQKK